MATIGLDELKHLLEAKERVVLIDVREATEVRHGMIPGALWIPAGRLAREIGSRLPELGTPIVTYCAVGARSLTAAETLRKLGYANARSASPGFVRWKELGFPVGPAPAGVGSALTEAQHERYARHLLLPEVGEEGQAALLAAKVLLLGAGGLGSPAALYLAAAGIGTLGIADPDVVDASNLQRQILHRTADVGVPKVESAARTLRELDPNVKVVPHRVRVTSENVEELFAAYDVIVDGTDNFPTRYLVNDASVFLGKPVVHGSIFRFEGQVTTFVPAKANARFQDGVRSSACYRCLYPEPPPPHLAPSCGEVGVLGVLCGIIGTLQATEVLKLLLRRGDVLAGRLLMYDALRTKFRELALARDPACPVCGDAPRITTYVDYEAMCSGR